MLATASTVRTATVYEADAKEGATKRGPTFAELLFNAGRVEGDYSGIDVMSTLTAITGKSAGWEPSSDLILDTDDPNR